ncbi:hypothetical protein Micbo1qcDRAFT_225805 [Microdochium bolleyi]|uniref:Major facilitator superfamily domain-containing protein n=1 Tax=Microdochium bolleyi TaxID=196109 RepID=A0A136J1J5_9PEZI|nr:hypothetical protein Micbo1qcDRAFT_225805 [Microdochium bolleyi]
MRSSRPVPQSHGRVASQHTTLHHGKSRRPQLSLRRRSHVSLQPSRNFSLTRSIKKKPIARDWPVTRKRFVAAMACFNTALIGVLAGIYSGILPSVQYMVVDLDHSMVFGNVGLYLGMALTSFFCWPLPLLHGRKPYIVCSLGIALPLLFPQALAVTEPRSPSTSLWKLAIFIPRTLLGFAMGLVSMNCHSTMTDLFGSSLMSTKPHQEVVDNRDMRRHGGGLGVWLGFWTWCFIGSLATGFVIGGFVIDRMRPSTGFYVCIGMTACGLVINVLCPEVRRANWRRSVSEVKIGQTVSRRLARGEIMMHRVHDGPRWWGQEIYHGVALSLEMLRQPGFAVVAVFASWVYAQVVLIIILLGSLSSRLYHMRPTYVGATVASLALGALAAVPFQKANVLSRARYRPPRTNSMTFDETITWTSHFVRRVIFVLSLPVMGALYVVVSTGPPMHIAVPAVLTAVIGFLSCLGISECNGMLMEAWDCSDLRPGVSSDLRANATFRPRINYSSFPRVNAGFAVIHSFSFVLASVATAVGGLLQRNMGQRAATGVMAAILFVFSSLLLTVLVRFRNVQIIPACKTDVMDKWTTERRISLHRHARAVAVARSQGRTDLDETEAKEPLWRPLILGNPTRKHRRMNLLELGALTRWTEIRKMNRLVDEDAHLNRQAVRAAREEIGRRGTDLMEDIHAFGDVVRSASKRSIRSLHSHNPAEEKRAVKATPASGGHHHVRMPTEVFSERECYIGQTVEEEPDGFVIGDWTNSGEASSGSSSLAVSQVRQRSSVRRDVSDMGHYGMAGATERTSSRSAGPH